MKTTNSNDSHEYMRLTHSLAIILGLPITRRRKNNINKLDGDSAVEGNDNYINNNSYADHFKLV